MKRLFSNSYLRTQENNRKMLSAAKKPQECSVCVFINCMNISVDKMSLHTWLGFVLRVIAASCAGIFFRDSVNVGIYAPGRGNFSILLENAALQKMWALFLMQSIQYMLHIPLQHLVCRVLRLTAVESQSKTVDEALKLLDLLWGPYIPSEKMSDGATSNFLVLWFLFKKKNKWWFYPNGEEK